VPDADDTAAAILALTNLNHVLGEVWDSFARVDGARWLADLQNWMAVGRPFAGAGELRRSIEADPI